MRRALERAEAAIARVGLALERPAPFYAAAALLLLSSLLVRLALAATANDVCCGHPDAWVYFHQSWVEFMNGRVTPDPHRGSGWQLLLFVTLRALHVPAGSSWTPYMTPIAGDEARAALIAQVLSAALSVGAVLATLLLARELMPRRAALLAAALVAFDPFLLRNSTSAMSEPVYVPIVVLATLTVLRARRHPAWLLATGALMALAHVLRVNGLVMFVALLAYAALLLRAIPRRTLLLWTGASIAAFLLVASPYLVWRADHLPGAFDYGTNQRFWADDLWDLDDAYWTGLDPAVGHPRETLADYASHHGWRDAATRLYQSVAWQLFDLFGSGRWPAWEQEGGAWVGLNPAEESALTPLLVALSLVAAFTALRSREWLFLPVALAFTFATFVWIYPLVRSVRYFSPLIPLFALATVAGWQHLAALARYPWLVGTAMFGAYLALYGGGALLHVGGALRLLAGSGDARFIVLATLALWALVAWALTRGRAPDPRPRSP